MHGMQEMHRMQEMRRIEEMQTMQEMHTMQEMYRLQKCIECEKCLIFLTCIDCKKCINNQKISLHKLQKIEKCMHVAKHTKLARFVIFPFSQSGLKNSFLFFVHSFYKKLYYMVMTLKVLVIYATCKPVPQTLLNGNELCKAL